MRGFAALRPASDKPHLVTTRSYLSYSDYELRDKLEHNPYSYLHVIHPAGMEGDDWSRPAERFAAVRSALDEFVERGWLERDQRASLYVYRQRSDGHDCTGIVGIADVEAAERGDIKVHELTLRAREEMFAGYLESVGVNAEPALLAYRDDAATQSAIKSVVSGRPVADFTTTDRVRHTLWIADSDCQKKLLQAIGGWGSLYVADGHHRLASSRLLAERKPEATSSHGFMAYCVPHTDLLMRGFHRVVCSDQLPSVEATLDALTPLGVTWEDQAKAATSGSVARGSRQVDWHCGTDQRVMRLTIPGDLPIPAWLDENFLAPLLGITEPRDDKRLGYIGGDASTAEIAAEAAMPHRWVFELEAMDFDELAAVADRGGVLPPKSTWIAPKLRSGLIIFDLDPLKNGL